jgi:hypothetical protein
VAIDLRGNGTARLAIQNGQLTELQASVSGTFSAKGIQVNVVKLATSLGE